MAILWKAGRDTWATYPDGYGKPAVMAPRPTFAGAVLGTASGTVQLMSDVWATGYDAVVWDGTKVTRWAYGNSEFGIDATVEVDATDDVKLAAALYEMALKAKKDADEAAAEKARTLAALKTPRVGKEAIVVKGRKIPKGTTGRIFWIGSSQFGMRVGLEPATAPKFFTALSNIEVVLDAEAA